MYEFVWHVPTVFDPMHSSMNHVNITESMKP